MRYFTTACRNNLLGHLFNKSVYSPVDTYYVGLSSTDPLADGSGVTEPSGGGYSRVSTTSSDWSDPAAGIIQNASDVLFAEASADWGNMEYFLVFDSSGGLFSYGALTEIVTVSSGDAPYFLAGSLVIAL